MLHKVEHPMSKPKYGINLIMDSIIVHRLSDGYALELPLGSDVSVPTEENLKHSVKPLTGSQLKAASLAFKRFDPVNGAFRERIILPRIKHKEMYGYPSTDPAKPVE